MGARGGGRSRGRTRLRLGGRRLRRRGLRVRLRGLAGACFARVVSPPCRSESVAAVVSRAGGSGITSVPTDVAGDAGDVSNPADLDRVVAAGASRAMRRGARGWSGERRAAGELAVVPAGPSRARAGARSGAGPASVSCAAVVSRARWYRASAAPPGVEAVVQRLGQDGSHPHRESNRAGATVAPPSAARRELRIERLGQLDRWPRRCPAG